MPNPTKQTVTKHAEAYVKAYGEALKGAATQDKLGASLREQAAWALTSFDEPKALAFLAEATGEAQRRYIAGTPRPAGASDSAPVVAWRNRFRNPYRAVAQELKDREASGVLKISWKEGAEAVTVAAAPEPKAAKSPVEKALAAIKAIDSDLTQPNCDALVKAIADKFGHKRLNKAVG